MLEATSHITNEFMEKHKTIPWKSIIAMRNKVVHAYFDINLDMVWKTITIDIPPLITELEKIIPPEKP
jgi:uncharacterized protein with HEPN domain